MQLVCRTVRKDILGSSLGAGAGLTRLYLDSVRTDGGTHDTVSLTL
jgi:hypothetical protein